MGEKSRGNWSVSWCGLKSKGCRGVCGKCIRKSEWRRTKGKVVKPNEPEWGLQDGYGVDN